MQLPEEISNQIDAMEEQFKKDYKDWTLEEKQKFGDHELLRQEQNQLRDLFFLTLNQHNEKRLGSDPFQSIAQGGQTTTSNQETGKFLKSCGPVDSKINFTIPFDRLTWVNELIDAVYSKQAVLLHGHWQSGKTSALGFVKSRAEEQGIRVYYLDIKAFKSTLKRFLFQGQTIFEFLGWAITGLSDSLPKFQGLGHFCQWSEQRHQGTEPPILLIDEYDEILKVGRKYPEVLRDMNILISYNRNTQRTFSSIVCAGTYAIVTALTEDVEYLDDDSDGELLEDAGVVRPVDAITPWNKALFIETRPFQSKLFREFAVSVCKSHSTKVEEGVIDDILETACGHPGVSIWMLTKAIQQSIGCVCLTTADWMESKRYVYNAELYKTPAMTKMLKRVKSFKKAESVLHVLVRDYQVNCKEACLVSFLRAVGIAKPTYLDNLTFTSPIIRDFLMQHQLNERLLRCGVEKEFE